MQTSIHFVYYHEFIQKIAGDEEFAKKHGNLPRIYGEMWRNWPTKSDKT